LLHLDQMQEVVYICEILLLSDRSLEEMEGEGGDYCVDPYCAAVVKGTNC
jgi:hypothetical protein